MSWSFMRSVQHAWRGVRLCWSAEPSFRIHVLVGAVVMALSGVVPLHAWQRVSIWFVVMMVLVLELINSSVERMVDLVKPRLHECAGEIKDLMAAAVLIASLFAVLIGLMIFLPSLVFALRLV